jgi:hypothetical protein
MSAGLVDQRVGLGHAQAHALALALALGLGGEKGFKNSGHLLFIHAFTVVCDLKATVAAAVFDGAIGRTMLHLGELHADGSGSCADAVHGIAQQVAQHGFQFSL